MISRRDFSIRLARVLGVSSSAHLLGAWQSAANPDSSSEASRPVSTDGLSQSEQAEVASRYQNLLRVWGERLSTEQRERVQRVLAANARMMQPIRSFQLENGDPPAEVLRMTADRVSAADRNPGRIEGSA